MKYSCLIILLAAAGLLAACGGVVPTHAVPSPAAGSPPAATPAATSESTPTVSPDLVAGARALTDRWLNGDDETLFARFDSTMVKVFPLDQVKQARQGLLVQAGAYQGVIDARAVKYQQRDIVYDIVYVTCHMEKGDVDVKMVFNEAGQIAGLFFQNAGTENPAAYVPPDYVDRAKFTEQEVTVGSGEWALSGTLSLPTGGGPFPALVLVHGSGPNDRDETIGPNKPFRDLAWGLASRGIAVLRYDKRTYAHALQFTPEILARLTVKEETIDDALAAVALLRQTPGIDPARIYVLGHSLGGYVLPHIGAIDPQIAGLIFLAAAARPLEDLTLEQVTYLAGLDGAISSDEQKAVDDLKAQVARVQDPALSPSVPASDLPLNIPAAYWLDLRGYDPPALAKGLPQRMLVLQGARDYQVTTVDLAAWQAALSSRPDVELKLYPDLNHLFMTGEGKSTPQEYQETGHVAGPVVADIAAWIVK